MAIITNALMKTCVTCEYWNGARASSPTGREVRYKIKITDDGKGICANKNSIKKGKPVRGGDIGCSRWAKWSSLK